MSGCWWPIADAETPGDNGVPCDRVTVATRNHPLCGCPVEMCVEHVAEFDEIMRAYREAL